MLSLSRLLELLLPDPSVNESPRLVETSLDLVCRALSGRFLHALETEPPRGAAAQGGRHELGPVHPAPARGAARSSR